jgi:hypothetical protein
MKLASLLKEMNALTPKPIPVKLQDDNVVMDFDPNDPFHKMLWRHLHSSDVAFADNLSKVDGKTILHFKVNSPEYKDMIKIMSKPHRFDTNGEVDGVYDEDLQDFLTKVKDDIQKAANKSQAEKIRKDIKGEKNPSLKSLLEELIAEAKKEKPSAGLTKKEKSAVVKKAKAGKDIGKKGKGFEKVAAKAAKQYGSKEAGEKVAAAAMWKNFKRKGAMNEAEDLGLALAQMLVATPLASWAGFTWAKAILAVPKFKEEYKNAQSKEDKIEVIKNALGYVFDPTNLGSYTNDNKLDENVGDGEIDHEGAMSKVQLSKIAEYATKVHDMLEDDTQLDAWVQDHIAQAAELMDQVGHFMENENKEEI